MESPMVGTFMVCLSQRGTVAETNERFVTTILLPAFWIVAVGMLQMVRALQLAMVVVAGLSLDSIFSVPVGKEVIESPSLVLFWCNDCWCNGSNHVELSSQIAFWR
jgi:hypothetical protein